MEVLKFTFLLIKLASRQYWSCEQICLASNVWMSGFLNIRSSRLEESCKKVLLTFLQNSLKNIKNIRDAVFNLKFQAKGSTTFLKKDSGICAFLRILQKFCRTPILQNADRLLLLKHIRIGISCFLVLKFWQILWKIPAKDFTSVVILQVTEKSEP